MILVAVTDSEIDLTIKLVGVLMTAVMAAATLVVRQLLKPVTEAVRTPSPDPGQPDVTVVRAAHDLAAAVEEVRGDLTSLRNDMADTARRQESTEAWITVVEGRIKGVATTQTEVLTRLGKNETAIAAAHERIDRLPHISYAPPFTSPPSPPPPPHSPWPTEDPR